MKLSIAGLDPSLSNLGMCKGELNLQTGVLESVTLELIETKPSNQKTVRKNSQDIERARDLYQGLHRFLTGVQAVCVEVPHGSQSARAMASYGVCIALLASLPHPLIQVTAEQVKLATVGHKTASKQAMMKWAYDWFPDTNWATHNGKRTNKNEHLADALAAIKAGVLTPEFELITLPYRNTLHENHIC